MIPITVKIADHAVAAGAEQLVTIGLGSCVAIALYNRHAQVGALAHVLLPDVAHGSITVPVGKFAATAVPAMLRRMRELNANGLVDARLIGGATMFAPRCRTNAPSLGTRNIVAARAACSAANIEVVAEDVGGAHGRSVYFDIADGAVLVRAMLRADVLL